MEAISLKLDGALLAEIDEKLSKHRYSTRTEFIRDAIRSKLTGLEKKEMIAALHRIHGASKHRTTNEQLHATRERLAKELEAKFK